MRQANSARKFTSSNTVYNVVTSHSRYAVQQPFMTKWSTRQLRQLWIGNLYEHITVFVSLTSALEQALRNFLHSAQMLMILVFCTMLCSFYFLQNKENTATTLPRLGALFVSVGRSIYYNSLVQRKILKKRNFN